MEWTQTAYRYDGSFAGFLTCVFESYVHKEAPACFLTQEDQRFSLWPEREVAADQERALRVYQSLGRKIGPEAKRLVTHGFLTCLEEREIHLWNFIRRGYEQGAQLARNLADPLTSMLYQAVYHAEHEAHMYKGFVRFSEQEGLLLAEIEPKNRVLPLMRPHFCGRFREESFVIHDRTHREALLCEKGRWAIFPVEDFQISAPDQEELAYRRLWRRFYDTIAIEGRYNPKCRMTNMPKRYWGTMTEFQTDPAETAPARSAFPKTKDRL